jgi:hypothetical protein
MSKESFHKEATMAIFDALLELSSAQDISQAAGTVASTNILDWNGSTAGATDLEMGAGEPVWLNVRIRAEVDSAGDAGTLVVALVSETSTTVDSNSTVIYQTPALAETALGAGAWVLRMPLPYDIDRDRYMGLLYTIGGETTTVGTIDAWLDHGPQSSYDTQVSASNI